jgi:hypothetical protein
VNSFHEGCTAKPPNNIFPNLGGNPNATSAPFQDVLMPTPAALEASNEVEDFPAAAFQGSKASLRSTVGVANTSGRTQLPSPGRLWFPSNSRSQHIDVEAAYKPLSGSVPHQKKVLRASETGIAVAHD